MKKTTAAKAEKPKGPKFSKSNYRRVTFDLPEDLLHRWSVYAAKLRTTKVAILRELLEKTIPPL